MRVLVWNLFHGRAEPAAGRPLLREFAETLAGWEWDVALLQEVPPWWSPLLGARCRADCRSAPTSRNQLLRLRRAVASRRPDLLKSNGGGANAILVRPPWTIAAHGRRRLRLRPERRIVHAVRLGDPRGGPFDGAWIGNVHGQLGDWSDAARLTAPLADLQRSTTQLEAWARTAARRAPIVLGGDLNLPRQIVSERLPGGWSRVVSSGPDHVVGVGVAAARAQRPRRGTLSDHAPLLVDLTVR